MFWNPVMVAEAPAYEACVSLISMVFPAKASGMKLRKRNTERNEICLRMEPLLGLYPYPQGTPRLLRNSR